MAATTAPKTALKLAPPMVRLMAQLLASKKVSEWMCCSSERKLEFEWLVMKLELLSLEQMMVDWKVTQMAEMSAAMLPDTRSHRQTISPFSRPSSRRR